VGITVANLRGFEVNVRIAWRLAFPLFVSRLFVGIVQSGLRYSRLFPCGWVFPLHRLMSNKPDCMDAVNDELKSRRKLYSRKESRTVFTDEHRYCFPKKKPLPT